MDNKLLGWGILGAVALAAAMSVMNLTERRVPAELSSASSGTPAKVAAVPETPATGGAPDSPPPASEVVAEAPPPQFDLVRADPDGTTLIAGSAEPGAQVFVLLDGVALGSAEADGAGRFAQFLDLPPSDAARVLTLRMSLDGREIASDGEVILSATPPGDPEEPSAPMPDAAAPMADAGAEQPQGDAIAEVDATDTAPAPVALLSTREGVELMQPPGPPIDAGAVAIDAITYDATGEVALSGRGSADAQLRIYLDNRAIGTATVPGDGRWQTDLPAITAGTYTLRVDQIGAGGDVTARAESPFLRESAETLTAATGDSGAALRLVTVQPGHTLWALARDRYGDGVAYIKLFEANKAQIRNPDLIYPGQVFELPD
ncbi:LysM peptidoglycan-binding domain-containing protein [Salipiger sp. 1_MG-2023]|uniref:LysM peptidoglycan-binding domain-containing protein n=1 Tax=Salipiger sp. 1_MG-2023 TaxID=3062665 RepID=UPI0026E2BB6A|nr:LysM peptidoglycan-binding domain-containing protein [Salipiger sp. 1_MG-2023]MDO6586568.1 LysM peptidoglycan-binding domain-containing protein [Salipiger sp. 1_MG-2023]